MLKKREINMTEGPLFGKIMRFVLPLMLTNILQVLYNAADMMIVSLSGEPDSVGAIGTTTSMINLFVNLFIGFSVGANVVVAKNIGAGNKEGAEKAVHTAILASIIFGILGAAIGIACQRSILTAMGNSGKLLRLSLTYTTIYFLGTPFLSLTNLSSPY